MRLLFFLLMTTVILFQNCGDYSSNTDHTPDISYEQTVFSSSEQTITTSPESNQEVLADLFNSQLPISFRDHVYFQSGVFEITNTGENVVSKCILTNRNWVKMNLQRTPCEINSATGKPHRMNLPKIYKPPVGTYVLFRHFGIDGSPTTNYTDWFDRVKNLENTDNFFGSIRPSLGVLARSDMVVWAIDSRQLPVKMRQSIPGAGLQAHFGSNFPNDGSFNIFENTNESKLRIDISMDLARYVMLGEGVSNITVGINFHVPDVNDSMVPLTLNVNIGHVPRITVRETISTDTRSLYARTTLNNQATFISPVRGEKVSQATNEFRDFTFDVTQENMSNLLEEMNVRRNRDGLTSLNMDLSRISLRGVALKNELQNLHKRNSETILTIRLDKFIVEKVTN